MVRTITRETKKEGQRKAKRHTTYMNKIKSNLILLMIGSHFTHDPSNVTCIQIMKFNSNGRFRTNITCQRNLLFYSTG